MPAPVDIPTLTPPEKEALFRRALEDNRVKLVAGYENAAREELASAMRFAHTEVSRRLAAAYAQDPATWSYDKLLNTERLRGMLGTIEGEFADAMRIGASITERYAAYAALRDAEFAAAALGKYGLLTGTGAFMDMAKIDYFVNFPIGGAFYGERFAALAARTQLDGRKALINGLIQGKGAREISKDLEGVTGLATSAAETITRTTIMNAANMASAAMYAEAGITEIRRLATLDRATCAECFARDGEVMSVSNANDISVHPECRCVPEPVVLAFPEGPRRGREYDAEGHATSKIFPGDTTGRDYLKALPENEQIRVLGPTRVEMLRAGRVDWPDFWKGDGELRLVRDLVRLTGRREALARPAPDLPVLYSRRAEIMNKIAALKERGIETAQDRQAHATLRGRLSLTNKKIRELEGKAPGPAPIKPSAPKAAKAAPKKKAAKGAAGKAPYPFGTEKMEMVGGDELRARLKEIRIVATGEEEKMLLTNLERAAEKFGELPESVLKAVSKIVSEHESGIAGHYFPYSRTIKMNPYYINTARGSLGERVFIHEFCHVVDYGLSDVFSYGRLGIDAKTAAAFRVEVRAAYLKYLGEIEVAVNEQVLREKTKAFLLKNISKTRELVKSGGASDWHWTWGELSLNVDDDWWERFGFALKLPYGNSKFSFGYAATSPSEFFAEVGAYLLTDPAAAAKFDPEIVALFKKVYPKAKLLGGA
jgi:SPP1 gp7 family putative phage head morphogenesis protein